MTLHPYAMPQARSALLDRMEGSLEVLLGARRSAQFVRDCGAVAGEPLRDLAQRIIDVTDEALTEVQRVLRETRR